MPQFIVYACVFEGGVDTQFDSVKHPERHYGQGRVLDYAIYSRLLIERPDTPPTRSLAGQFCLCFLAGRVSASRKEQAEQAGCLRTRAFMPTTTPKSAARLGQTHILCWTVLACLRLRFGRQQSVVNRNGAQAKCDGPFRKR